MDIKDRQEHKEMTMPYALNHSHLDFDVLTKFGISLFDENGYFKNPYDIIKELAVLLEKAISEGNNK